MKLKTTEWHPRSHRAEKGRRTVGPTEQPPRSVREEATCKRPLKTTDTKETARNRPNACNFPNRENKKPLLGPVRAPPTPATGRERDRPAPSSAGVSGEPVWVVRVSRSDSLQTGGRKASHQRVFVSQAQACPYARTRQTETGTPPGRAYRAAKPSGAGRARRRRGRRRQLPAPLPGEIRPQTGRSTLAAADTNLFRPHEHAAKAVPTPSSWLSLNLRDARKRARAHI